MSFVWLRASNARRVDYRPLGLILLHALCWYWCFLLVFEINVPCFSTGSPTGLHLPHASPRFLLLFGTSQRLESLLRGLLCRDITLVVYLSRAASASMQAPSNVEQNSSGLQAVECLRRTETRLGASDHYETTLAPLRRIALLGSRVATSFRPDCATTSIFAFGMLSPERPYFSLWQFPRRWYAEAGFRKLCDGTRLKIGPSKRGSLSQVAKSKQSSTHSFTFPCDS